MKKTKDQCDHDKHKKTGEAEANLGPAAQRNQQQLAAGPYITQKKKNTEIPKKKQLHLPNKHNKSNVDVGVAHLTLTYFFDFADGNQCGQKERGRAGQKQMSRKTKRAVVKAKLYTHSFTSSSASTE